jgi:membrane-associated phospholipid phosphatase
MATPLHSSYCDKSSEWRRSSVIVWVIVALMALTVALTPLLTTFKFAYSTFTLPLAAFPALTLGTWFYRRRRKDERLASALECTAQIGAFTAFAAPLSYIAAAANLPLQDRLFNTLDSALYLDWSALLGWMNAHPLLHAIFALTYLSFAPQAITTVLALAFCAHFVRLRVFVLAFMLAAIVTIAISALFPAEGVWGFYKLTAANYPDIAPVTRTIHLSIFHGLRDGSFRILMGTGSEGIITFPSLHAALALIFIFALWPVRYLRWVALAVNGLMIAATPVDGGHYYVDVIAGIAIAVVCWMAASKLARRSANTNRATIPAGRLNLIPGE